MKHLFLLFALFVTLVLISCSGNQSTQEISFPPLVSDSPEYPSGDTSLDTDSNPSLTTPSTQVLPTVTRTPIPTQVASSTPWIAMPLMGSEPHHPEQETVLSLLADSGTQIVRLNGVVWFIVEPQEAQYNWAALHNFDIALQELAARNIDVILIVRGTPGWAQKVYGSACGPVSQEKFQAFADFMSELVRRYSSPPYKVKYWEIGNEPDVDPSLVPSDSVFGCWGDAQDTSYGGGYYAEMLKVVYPAIKSVDPDAQVLIGGLLLDCDPYNPPEGKDCLPSRFFNGILANGGANYFDIVSYHGYPHYVNQSLAMDLGHPAWKDRGGVVVGKINYLREVMSQFDVEKPIFLTESSLNCPNWNTKECTSPDEYFFETQADYLVRLFVRNWALDVAGTIWYDFEGQGWRYGGLVGEDLNNLKPTYHAFKYLNQKLAGMAYIGEAPLPEELQGYIFEGGNRETWVIWSLDESSQTVALPSNVIAVYDKYGQAIISQESQITISSPVYFDMEP